MSWTILKASLMLRRVSFMWYAIGLTAYGWMIVAFFPLIEANPEYLEIVQDVWSEDLLAAFGGADLQFTTLGGFLGIEYLSLMWVFIAGTAVITFIGGALGGAVEDGTMEVTLSQPVSRMSVSFTRWLGMAVYSAGISLVTVAGIYLTGPLHGVEVPLDGMALLFVVCTLFQLAVGGLAFAISAMSSGKGRTTGISLGVVVAMYLADILGQLNSDYSWLSDVSLFHYWEPHRYIDDVAVAGETWLVFGIGAALFFLAGMYVFQKRDVV